MTHRAAIYGKKKAFIYEHEADILALRRRMSARKVAEIYCNIITSRDIYNVENLNKISKK